MTPLRRGVPALLPVSAALVAASFAAGLVGAAWLTELLLVLALVQGVVAGLVLPVFWVAVPHDSSAARDIFRQLAGPGGKFLLFLSSVAFAAVESHAVGTGLATGAPRIVLSMLVPPLIIGALALRGALSGVGER